MNGILGMVQILEEMSLTNEQADYIQIIKNSAQSLMSIINNILDLSRIELGAITLQKERVEIRSLVGDLDRFFTPTARKKGLNLKVHCADVVPQAIQTDEGCLKQVLVNLIANSIKFTHKGHVELSIDCPQKTESDCTLIIHVKDTGIGITEEAQAIIFNEFSQADESHTREYGGTGLGLAISKRIIDKMGGTLTVNSKPNEGAVFSFSASFPLVKDEEVGDAAPDQPALKNFIFSNTPHVLVVEDNLVNQRVISMIIEKAGCRVAIARNGKQAIEYLHLNDPPDERPRCDVILMDIQMPVMDGLQATEIIRQSDLTIPIIALTAHAMKGDREKFIQAKMNDYLSKPIQKEELLHLLRQHTGLA